MCANLTASDGCWRVVGNRLLSVIQHVISNTGVDVSLHGQSSDIKPTLWSVFSAPSRPHYLDQRRLRGKWSFVHFWDCSLVTALCYASAGLCRQEFYVPQPLGADSNVIMHISHSPYQGNVGFRTFTMNHTSPPLHHHSPAMTALVHHNALNAHTGPSRANRTTYYVLTAQSCRVNMSEHRGCGLFGV